jgi:hypothetical protein
LLSTVRSRRVGAGYRVDSGRREQHPVTGRAMTQADGPQHWVSERPSARLSDDEAALLAWATLEPSGVVAWEASLSGSFSQLVSTRGRTAPEPNNTLATDLLVVDDDGVALYRPTAPWPQPGEQVGPEVVREYWRTGRTRLLDSRPDLDFALRDPAYPDVPLMGTHQYNLNRPGSLWLLPVTDAGRLLSGVLDLCTGKHVYLVDEFSCGRPAGLDEFVRRGLLEKPVPISAHEQAVLRTSTYPAGCMVQNTRLAAEALGLGAWWLSAAWSRAGDRTATGVAPGRPRRQQPARSGQPVARRPRRGAGGTSGDAGPGVGLGRGARLRRALRADLRPVPGHLRPDDRRLRDRRAPRGHRLLRARAATGVRHSGAGAARRGLARLTAGHPRLLSGWAAAARPGAGRRRPAR